MAIQKITSGPLKQIYKNLYYDNDSQMYYFINGNNRRPVVKQETYLLIYIIELLQGRKL